MGSSCSSASDNTAINQSHFVDSNDRTATGDSTCAENHHGTNNGGNAGRLQHVTCCVHHNHITVAEAQILSVAPVSCTTQMLTPRGADAPTDPAGSTEAPQSCSTPPGRKIQLSTQSQKEIGTEDWNATNDGLSPQSQRKHLVVPVGVSYQSRNRFVQPTSLVGGNTSRGSTQNLLTPLATDGVAFAFPTSQFGDLSGGSIPGKPSRRQSATAAVTSLSSASAMGVRGTLNSTECLSTLGASIPLRAGADDDVAFPSFGGGHVKMMTFPPGAAMTTPQTNEFPATPRFASRSDSHQLDFLEDSKNSEMLLHAYNPQLRPVVVVGNPTRTTRVPFSQMESLGPRRNHEVSPLSASLDRLETRHRTQCDSIAIVDIVVVNPLSLSDPQLS